MAVSVNATGTLATSTSVSSVNYTGITVAAGSNSALIFVVEFDSGSTSPSATWDSGGSNQAMTLLSTSAKTSGGSWIFGLRAPTTGNKTLALSFTTASGLYLSAIAFNGVDQASDTTAFPSAGRVNSSASNTSGTVTVASNANNYCVAITALSPNMHRLSQSDTELFYSTAAPIDNAEAQYGVGSSSKTMTVTIDNSGSWSIAAVDVAAVAAGGFLAAWARGSNLPVIGTGNY